jgi:hypothetical protein
MVNRRLALLDALLEQALLLEVDHRRVERAVAHYRRESFFAKSCRLWAIASTFTSSPDTRYTTR